MFLDPVLQAYYVLPNAFFEKNHEEHKDNFLKMASARFVSFVV